MKGFHRSAVLLWLLFGWITVASAQTGFHLKAPDSLRYSLYLNGELNTPEVVGSFSIDSLSAGDCLLDLMVKGDPMTHVRAQLQLDTSGIAELELVTDPNLRYRLIRHDVEAVVDYTQPAAVVRNQALDLVVTEVERTGCAPPLTPSLFQEKIGELAQLPFERDKVDTLKSWLGGVCLTTSQIRTVVDLIEDESRRLEVLVVALPSCFDRSSFPSLIDLLYLSRSRKRFQMMVGD